LKGAGLLLGALFYPANREPELTGAKDLLQKYCTPSLEKKNKKLKALMDAFLIPTRNSHEQRK